MHGRQICHCPCSSTGDRGNAIGPAAATQAAINGERMVFLRGAVTDLASEFPPEQSDPADGIAIRPPRRAGERHTAQLMLAAALVVARISRASAILTLVASEAGTGFIPLSLAGLVPNGVVVRPFAKPALTVPFSLVWRNDPSNCVVDRFVTIARDTTGREVEPSYRAHPGRPSPSSCARSW
jgi:DNA-binding transcriptional LysR family regulator